MITTLSTTSTSGYLAVTDTSVKSAALLVGRVYRYACSIDSLVKFAVDPTAAGADHNHFVPAGSVLEFRTIAIDVDGTPTAPKLAALRVGSTSGVATVSLVQ